MSKIAFKPNESGTATFEIQAPATNTNRVLELPDEAGKILTSASDLAGVTGVGKVLQVVRATDSTTHDTTSASFIDVPGMAVTITPQKSDSAIIILAAFGARAFANASTMETFFAITDNSNNILTEQRGGHRGLLRDTAFTAQIYQNYAMVAHSTPATTLATTYKLRFRAFSGVAQVDAPTPNQMFAIEVAA